MMDEEVYQLLKEIANYKLTLKYKLAQPFANYVFRAKELVEKEDIERTQAERLEHNPEVKSDIKQWAKKIEGYRCRTCKGTDVRQHPETVTIWGCVNCNGASPCVFINFEEISEVLGKVRMQPR